MQRLWCRCCAASQSRRRRSCRFERENGGHWGDEGSYSEDIAVLFAQARHVLELEHVRQRNLGCDTERKKMEIRFDTTRQKGRKKEAQHFKRTFGNSVASWLSKQLCCWRRRSIVLLSGRWPKTPAGRNFIVTRFRCSVKPFQMRFNDRIIYSVYGIASASIPRKWSTLLRKAFARDYAGRDEPSISPNCWDSFALVKKPRAIILSLNKKKVLKVLGNSIASSRSLLFYDKIFLVKFLHTDAVLEYVFLNRLRHLSTKEL